LVLNRHRIAAPRPHPRLSPVISPSARPCRKLFLAAHSALNIVYSGPERTLS
jgi:hypothetical protein